MTDFIVIEYFTPKCLQARFSEIVNERENSKSKKIGLERKSTCEQERTQTPEQQGDEQKVKPGLSFQSREKLESSLSQHGMLDNDFIVASNPLNSKSGDFERESFTKIVYAVLRDETIATSNLKHQLPEQSSLQQLIER